MAPRYIFAIFLLASIILSRCLDVSACATNCQCTPTSNECYLDTCDDLLEYESDTLIIHGELCAHHVEQLEGLNDGTFIILMDDECSEIPNCESVKDPVTQKSTVSTTTEMTTKKTKLKKKLPTSPVPTSGKTTPLYQSKDRCMRHYPGTTTPKPKAIMNSYELDLPTKYK